MSLKRHNVTNWRDKKLNSKLRKHWRPKAGTRVYLPHKRAFSFSNTGFILGYVSADLVEVGVQQSLRRCGFERSSKLYRKKVFLRSLRPAPMSVTPEEMMELLSDWL